MWKLLTLLHLLVFTLNSGICAMNSAISGTAVVHKIPQKMAFWVCASCIAHIITTVIWYFHHCCGDDKVFVQSLTRYSVMSVRLDLQACSTESVWVWVCMCEQNQIIHMAVIFVKWSDWLYWTLWYMYIYYALFPFGETLAVSRALEEQHFLGVDDVHTFIIVEWGEGTMIYWKQKSCKCYSWFSWAVFAKEKTCYIATSKMENIICSKYQVTKIIVLKTSCIPSWIHISQG